MPGILRRRETQPNENPEMTRQTRSQDPFQWLASWDPFRAWGTLDPFRRIREMSNLDPFAELTGGFPQLPRSFVPDLEVREKNDGYVICADVPGLTENDVTVEVAGNRLTISGKRDEVERDETDRYWTYERSYGHFTRSFMLPEGTMSDQIDARLENGVLEVRIPKVKGEESTKIRVTGAGAAQLHGRTPASNVRSQAQNVSAGSPQTGTITSTTQESSHAGAHEKAA